MEVKKEFTDSELVDSIRTGTHVDEAIRYLYRHYYESLSRYILNNSGSRLDAEDMFQQTVVCFIDRVRKDKFRGESSVKTFLFSLNRHAWLNELKRRGQAALREERIEPFQDRVELDAGLVMADRQSGDQLVRLMDKIGNSCGRILLMFYYEEFSIRDMVEELHYENELVIRHKKYRCIKQLEQMLNDKPELKKTLKNLLNE